MKHPNHQPTPQQSNFCTYSGFFGILLAIACLLQTLAYGTNFWIVDLFKLIFVFAAFSFLLLALQKSLSVPCCIITAVLTIAVQMVLIIMASVSVIIMLFAAYSFIIVIFLFDHKIYAALKARAAVQRKEKEIWNGKI